MKFYVLMTLMQHCYNKVDIAAGLCWGCLRCLWFLGSSYSYIHRFWVYSYIYLNNSFSFDESSFDCGACGVTPLFPRHFFLHWSYWRLFELIIPPFLPISVIKAYKSLWINQGFDGVCNIFGFDILYYFKIWVCIFHVTHSSSTTKFLLQNQTCFSYEFKTDILTF